MKKISAVLGVLCVSAVLGLSGCSSTDAQSGHRSPEPAPAESYGKALPAPKAEVLSDEETRQFCERLNSF